jgi:glycosyltransferase involved in cell wall biosynthesis
VYQLNPPLVSIIVPCYNYGHLLGETLSSIEVQSYSNWECIIVDNGSTDNTRQVAEEWANRDKRFTYLYIHYSTTSIARNTGVNASSGDFIQFVDSDDQIASKKIQNQVEIFTKNPDVSIVYSHARYYDHGNPDHLRLSISPLNKPWMIEFSGKSWDILPIMFERNIFVISSPLLKKNVWEDTGGFFNKLNWVEDWEFYFRCLAKNYLIIFDPSQDSHSYIRVHPKSLSTNNPKMFEQSLIARGRINKLLLSLDGFNNVKTLMNENKRYIKFVHRLLVNEYANNNRFNYLKHLFAFAWLERDIKLILKGIFFAAMNKSIVLPTE